MTDATTIARTGAFALFTAALIWSAPAQAQSTSTPYYQPTVTSEADDAAEVPAHLRRQTVSYSGSEAPGTVVIDTPNTFLYYVLGGGKAIRYGIGVGREGFTWSGIKTVDRKAEWPDWVPPTEMLERQPYLPRFMAGGPGNPLGARAMYLGGTIYRIHGTNQPSSIGKRVSSGCIRMVNEDVIDLYARVNLGTKVVVLPMTQRPANVAQSRPAAPATQITSSYAPVSAPAAAWDGIRPRGIY
jgi:lipoprotein-anchoring transpeptidase ErfK/SrfK